MVIYKVTNIDDFADRVRQSCGMIINAGLPEYIKQAIYKSYDKMCKYGMCLVAVRSSATAEDMP